jgi:hypothetical protein
MTSCAFDEGGSPSFMASLAKSHRRAGLYRQHGSMGESAMALNAMQFFCYVNFVVCVVDFAGPGLFFKLSLFMTFKAVLIRDFSEKNRPADLTPYK